MKNDFYKHIKKRGNSYEINKRIGDKVESFGTYSKLTDALYERDRLIKVDWDWDDLMALEETENFYEQMDLPYFVHEYSYIRRIPLCYKVFIKTEFKGRFRNKKDAVKFAEEIGGRIVEVRKKYRIEKKINGKSVYFGQYKSLEDAQKRRDELIENGWKK